MPSPLSGEGFAGCRNQAVLSHRGPSSLFASSFEGEKINAGHYFDLDALRSFNGLSPRVLGAGRRNRTGVGGLEGRSLASRPDPRTTNSTFFMQNPMQRTDLRTCAIPQTERKCLTSTERRTARFPPRLVDPARGDERSVRRHPPTRQHQLTGLSLVRPSLGLNGASGWVRTTDAHAFNVPLYRLSYAGLAEGGGIELLTLITSPRFSGPVTHHCVAPSML